MYQASSSYILRKVAGTHVLISVGENIANFNGYVQLNDTAAFLWEQLKEPKSVEELTAAVAGEFEVGAEQAEADVKEFLEELLKEKLVSADG